MFNYGINSGVTISAISDGIGYSYGLEILVLMTLLYFVNDIKRGLSSRQSRLSGDEGTHPQTFV